MPTRSNRGYCQELGGRALSCTNCGKNKVLFKFDKPGQDVYYSCHDCFVFCLLLDDEELTAVTEVEPDE